MRKRDELPRSETSPFANLATDGDVARNAATPNLEVETVGGRDPSPGSASFAGNRGRRLRVGSTALDPETPIVLAAVDESEETLVDPCVGDVLVDDREGSGVGVASPKAPRL